ncbi:hypothetical protein Tco_0470778 [Tanacetum coccineum]
MTRGHTWLTRESTWHATWWPDPTRPMTRPDLAHDPPIDWRSTTVDRWSGGGQRWSATVDRCRRYCSNTRLLDRGFWKADVSSYDWWIQLLLAGVRELLQARENLMETIQAFLKEYDHIPPEEKCMALLLAEERFLKIKQAVEEEQNQPEVMQELLLKLMNGLQILKGIQPKQAEQEEQAAKSFTSYGNFSMIDDVKVLQVRENLMKNIQTFLRKFSRIPFGEIPKVLLIAWERFSKIKHAFTDKQYQQEDIQELMSKLLEDVQNINEELSECINSPSWNRPTFYNDDDDRDILITSPKIDFLPEEFVGELDLIDPILLGIDEDDCDEDDFDEEEGEIDDDILQIEDEILREKL